jgi:hypothetical protein
MNAPLRTPSFRRPALDLRFTAVLLFVAVAFPLAMHAIPVPPLTWAERHNVRNAVIAEYGEEAEPRLARFDMVTAHLLQP